MLSLPRSHLKHQMEGMPSRAIWPAVVVIFSLTLFLAGQMRVFQALPPLAFAYIPPAMASLSAAIYCWLRFRQQAHGWWLGCSSAFMLFFILTGQQILLEMASAFNPGWGNLLLNQPLPWQPWFVARLVLAVGILSAYSVPDGLLKQAGSATRQAAFMVGLMAVMFCPLWPSLVSADLYAPAANGLSVLDSLALVLSGFALILAYARARFSLHRKEPFDHVLYTWLIALAWSSACRAFPFGSVPTAVWIEIMVVGVASVTLCAQLMWHIAGSGGNQQNQIAALTASRTVLGAIAGSDEEELPDLFARISMDVTRCSRLMLLIRHSDATSIRVAASWPATQNIRQKGDELSLEPGRRNGFANGPAARCIRNLQTIVVSDAESDVEFIHWREFADSGSYQVSIPLLVGGECFGALLLWFRGDNWRPWLCVPMAEEIAAACSPLLGRLPSFYSIIRLPAEPENKASDTGAA